MRGMCIFYLFPECDATNRAECDLCGWLEDQATQNICAALQSLLQVIDDQAECVQFRSVNQFLLTRIHQGHLEDDRGILSFMWEQDVD